MKYIRRYMEKSIKNHAGATIGIFGFYGNENLGDEAIIDATIARIREYLTDAEIVCYSVNPRDSERRYGVRAFSIMPGGEQYISRRTEMKSGDDAERGSHTHNARSNQRAFAGIKLKLKRSKLLVRLVRFLQLLKRLPTELRNEIAFARKSDLNICEADVLVIAGSNQFLDNFGGTWRFPYTMYRWTWLARRNKIPILMLSVGAGPIFSSLSRWFIKQSIKRAQYISFRDAGSARLLGFSEQNSIICPDLAFSLAYNRPSASAIPPDVEPSALVIGINPMAIHAKGYWYKEDERKYRRYVDALGSYVASLADQSQPFVLIANQPRDELVIDDVIDRAKACGCPEDTLANSVRKSSTVAEYMNVLNEVDIVVATRFHATVLALLAGKPVLGLCYYRKSAELLSEFGQDAYVFDADEFDVDDLIAKTASLKSAWGRESERIIKRADESRKAVIDQFEKSLTIVGLGQTGMKQPGNLEAKESYIE